MGNTVAHHGKEVTTIAEMHIYPHAEIRIVVVAPEVEVGGGRQRFAGQCAELLTAMRAAAGTPSAVITDIVAHQTVNAGFGKKPLHIRAVSKAEIRIIYAKDFAMITRQPDRRIVIGT